MRQSEGGDYAAAAGSHRLCERGGPEAGGRLRQITVSERRLPYEFKVLNSSVPNAWALPGGKIAVNRGLLTELKNEAELAAVLGHEIVHAAARHGAQAQERGTLLQGGLVAAQIGAAHGRRRRAARRPGADRRGCRRAADHHALRSRCGAAERPVRHAADEGRGLRSARRDHAAGNLRAAVGRPQAELARGPVRLASAVGRARGAATARRPRSWATAATWAPSATRRASRR